MISFPPANIYTTKLHDNDFVSKIITRTTTSSQNKQTFTVWTEPIAPVTVFDFGPVTAYAMGIKFTPAPTTPSPPHTCPPGQHWDDTTQSCVPDSLSPPQQSECNKEIAITDATSSGNQPTFVPRNAIDRNPNKVAINIYT